MPSTTSFKFGDVVLVGFPFTNHETLKKRPAVVINSTVYSEQCPDLIILAITSRSLALPGFGEIALSEWMKAGLLKSSYFKPLIATVEKGKVQRHLGRLGPVDASALKELLQKMLGMDHVLSLGAAS